MDTPYVTHRFDSVASTQDEARQRFDGAPCLVVAAEQRSGRGRSGRPWLHAPRAVAASLAFVPDWPTATWPRLALVAGLAARESVLESLGTAVGLKWPNDLVLEGAKVGGVLSEADRGLVVIGAGINLWWPDPPAGIAGLLGDDPGAGYAAKLAGDWAATLLDRVARGASDWGHTEYAAACVTVGAPIVWEPDGAGTAVGIAEDGRLLVDTPQGRLALGSGEVTALRRATLPSDHEETPA